MHWPSAYIVSASAFHAVNNDLFMTLFGEECLHGPIAAIGVPNDKPKATLNNIVQSRTNDAVQSPNSA